VLWEATRSATPVLLACAAGAFVLANAIVREDDTDMTRSPVMRAAALVLALGILPLAVFAAVSMGTRIAQHGLSPERLWALVAIAVACAYGLAALVAVVRGRLRGWWGILRRANLNLAVGVSVVALFLALPVLDFGAISAANQVSRLERGTVSAKDFDYDALRWDFGDAGRKALAGLARSGDPAVAKRAKEALARKDRPWHWPAEDDRRDERLANIHFRFEDPALREAVRGFVRDAPYRCTEPCVALDLGRYADGAPHLALVEGQQVTHLRRSAEGVWVEAPVQPSRIDRKQAGPKGTTPQVEVRPYAGRQIYVDGQPVGNPFE